MKYRFEVDGRAFGSPLRDTWDEAARDAVAAGYAVHVVDGIKLQEGATIARYSQKDKTGAIY